jgi:hypothetical protein
VLTAGRLDQGIAEPGMGDPPDHPCPGLLLADDLAILNKVAVACPCVGGGIFALMKDGLGRLTSGQDASGRSAISDRGPPSHRRPIRMFELAS